MFISVAKVRLYFELAVNTCLYGPFIFLYKYFRAMNLVNADYNQKSA